MNADKYRNGDQATQNEEENLLPSIRHRLNAYHSLGRGGGGGGAGAYRRHKTVDHVWEINYCFAIDLARWVTKAFVKNTNFSYSFQMLTYYTPTMRTI